jgi:hypothetical protein
MTTRRLDADFTRCLLCQLRTEPISRAMKEGAVARFSEEKLCKTLPADRKRLILRGLGGRKRCGIRILNRPFHSAKAEAAGQLPTRCSTQNDSMGSPSAEMFYVEQFDRIALRPKMFYVEHFAWRRGTSWLSFERRFGQSRLLSVVKSPENERRDRDAIRSRKTLIRQLAKIPLSTSPFIRRQRACSHDTCIRTHERSF